MPEVKEEYGCVTTVFKRPDWTGDNTPDRRTGIFATRTGTDAARTGTTHRLSGTVWAITGTTGAMGVEDTLARLPKLRKDARANVETVLHELIADKTATIPQICARTGMALRTINNALATLRGAGILNAPIQGRKPSVDQEKPLIEPEKPSIEVLASKYNLTRPTSENIHKLLCAFGLHIVFGRSMIMAETGLEITAAGDLINTMLQHHLLDTVKGYGKGKYRFRAILLSDQNEAVEVSK